MLFNQFLKKHLCEVKQSNSFFNKGMVQELLDTFSVGCEFEMFIKDIQVNLKDHVENPKTFAWCVGKSQVDFMKPNAYIKDAFRGIGRLLNNSIDARNVLYTTHYVPYNESETASLYSIEPGSTRPVVDSHFKSWQITADYSVKSDELLKRFPIELKTPVFDLIQFFGQPNAKVQGVFGDFLNRFFYPYGVTDASTGLHVNISSTSVDMNFDEIHWPLVIKMMSYLNKPSKADLSGDFEFRGEKKGIKGSTGYSVNNLKQEDVREFMVRYLQSPTTERLKLSVINNMIKTQEEKYSMINFMKLEHNVLEIRVMGGEGYENKAELIKEYVFKLIQSILLCSENALTEIWGLNTHKVEQMKKASLKAIHSRYTSKSNIKAIMLEDKIKQVMHLLNTWPLKQLPHLLFDKRYTTLEEHLRKIFAKETTTELKALRTTTLPQELRLSVLRWLKPNYAITPSKVSAEDLSQTPLQQMLDNTPASRFQEGSVDQFKVFLTNLKRIASN
jgi:hypothetical protein